ncbi:HAMP domain-containing sensor histidine kinase [Hyalangium rubrum]|uniref:histidine kinase n=1 Tax=Hyalangium rubrum TaxID=3103134 RepID=A0ABU5H9S1_9BACT|nr:HAMP domain-containing sensor histidine kinase [Hyalangium sp. s54d21]MDY7230225.1 HAMP domain-containing sensor histidine kinase [Hyalangium sp. s54d21]
MSLKAMFTSLVTVLGVLVLAAAASLWLLTSYLHRVTGSLGSSVEGVRLAEELEVELLTHYRQSNELSGAPDDRVRQLFFLETQLTTLMEEISRTATTPEESERIADLRQRVAHYLIAQREAHGEYSARLSPRAGADLDQALVSLEELIELKVKQARHAEAEAARWDRLTRLGGPILAALLLIGLLVSLVWVRRAVLRPVAQVRQAMRRFASGRKRTRAAETGPLELREVARTFNEMASSITRQQEDQLTFLAGVAHDLRNPLSALKMSTAFAAPGRAEVSPERLQKMFALARRQVERLDRMVGDLLDSTRIEAGKLELQLEERDARELARAVVELYQATGPGHELRLSLPETPVPLCCDGIRIEQVLNNLVSNALKYSPVGTRVEVTVERQGEEAALSVADQGIGISAEEQLRLFAAFQRARGARERAPGAGLGLSVARRIVEAHGGHIEVESTPGQGSVFRVRLPIARAATQGAPRAEGPATAWGTGEDSVH